MSLETRRVLIALHSELLGGATISILRPLPLLEKRGWRFSFWVPTPGPARDWLEEKGYEVHGMKRPLASSLKALREPPGLACRLASTPRYLAAYRRALREVNPAVVHANSLYAFEEAAVAKASGRAVVLHVHDMLPASRKGWPARRIARHAADLTIAVSRACAASYAHGGWEPGLVYEAAPVPDAPAEIRAEPRPFVVGTVGVISTRKGSDLFVEAAELAGAELGQRTVEFRMVGSPTDALEANWAGHVLARARAAGVRHQASADVEAELREWDAFVLPSRRDPCPIALLEAMAFGLPCIGTNADGIPEQLGDGAGILVPAGDAKALARAITSIATADHAERERVGGAARTRVEERFSLERQAAGLERAYLGAIGSA